MALPGVRGLDHIGITVPDLDEAHEFLVDILGAVHVYTLGPKRADDDWMSVQLGVHPRTEIREIRFYRLGHGTNIEVFDRDRLDALSFVVDERPSAQGGLVRVGDHLVSAVDFEDPALRVYSLADPARPAFVGGFGDGAGSPIRLAADGAFVVVAHQQDERVSVVLYDLTRPTRPSRVFERALDGTALAVAVGPLGVLVIEADVTLERGRLLWLTLDGAERAFLALEDLPFDPGLVVRDDLVYFTGGAARLTRVRARAGTLQLEAVVGEPSGVGTAIAFDRGLVVLGTLDVYEEASLRALSTTETFGGYPSLAATNGKLFASSGGGVTELVLRCE